jgi:hypothetical protein
MIWHQRPLSIMYEILWLTNSTLLLLIWFSYAQNLVPNSWLLIPFHGKMFILLIVGCRQPPIWPARPLNITYFDSSFDTVTSELALYKLINFVVQNLISIFRYLSHFTKNPPNSKAQYKFLQQSDFLWREVVDPHAQLSSWRRPVTGIALVFNPTFTM